MNWQFLFPAFLLGGISSFHCVGMCGPIALSLPVQFLPNKQKLFGIILYNVGRIVAYASIGLLFGLAGRQFFMGSLQQTFSIVLGAAILFFLALSQFSKRAIEIPLVRNFQIKLQLIISRYIRRQNLYGIALIGFANGFLPCGMVYMALAGALGTGSVYGGIGYMTLFGIGTIPLMLAVTWFGYVVNLSVRNTVRRLTPIFIAIIGIMLILRGLNLNIPYLSPLIESATGRVISCH